MDSENSLNLAGVWHSKYAYYSDSRQQEITSDHRIAFEQHDHMLMGKSLLDETGSDLRIQLEIDTNAEGTILTGVWREVTSKTGPYKGRIYKGSLDLILDGNEMKGVWTGADHTRQHINSGQWSLHRESKESVETI